MKNNIILKITLIFLIFIISTILLKNNVYASSYSISNIFIDAENFLQVGNSASETINTNALKDTSTFIFNLLSSIGLVVAIIVGMVLGIQFMISSAEDKAKVKEALIAYTISCVVLFGAYGIWSAVINMVQDVTSVSVEGTTGSSSGSGGGGTGGGGGSNPVDPTNPELELY